ncbi:MAG: M23 family metallopeptidase [Halanaerobacter sp.]
MFEDNQNEKITIQIIPETESDVFSIKLTKKVIKYFLYFAIISFIILAGVISYYYYQYHTTQKEVKALSPYREKVENLRERNNYLQDKLSKLSQETEEMREEFNQIQKENRRIKEMIDFENKDEVSSNDYDNFKTISNQSLKSQTVSKSKDSPPSGELISTTKQNLSSLNEGISRKKEDLSNLKDDIVDYKDYLAAKPRGWPILNDKGKITSKYGQRFHPIKQERIFHEGVDIGVWYNHKVIATGRAKVVFAGWKSGYGRVVILDHGYGYRTLYGHNNKILVRTGEVVNRGDAIALSGNSGRSTGPHLHYEVLVNGNHTNPQKFF